jgi:hypothetical protein
VNALALVLNEKLGKLGCLEWWWLGVFIALKHQTTVGGGCCRWAHRTIWCATGHCPVRQRRHPTVRVLEQLTVGAFVFLWHHTVRCRTGQLLFIVRCALTLPRTVAHCSVAVSRCSRPLRWIVVTPLVHRIVRWHTGQSGEL